nr:MAG TPA: hypothetical protein [Caudoviricetes sp.]
MELKPIQKIKHPDINRDQIRVAGRCADNHPNLQGGHVKHLTNETACNIITCCRR